MAEKLQNCREQGAAHVAGWARYTGTVLAAASLSLSIVGCGTRPPAAAQVVRSGGPAGSTQFQLDANATEIWLFLHADGPLAKVGHTHVITTRGLRGSIWVHPQLEHSSCDFQLPVDAFVVDDPQERAAAGAEFAEPLDEGARAGTREHMLGDRQLAAAQYPLVSLHCQRVAAAADGVTLQLTVTLRDHQAQLAVPVKWQRSGNTLQASGEFSFTQTALGLEPYSMLFGALRVSDETRARFQLVARQN